LVFIKLAVLVFLFSFVLKRNYNETDKYIHHEKRYYNYVYDVICGNDWSVVVYRTLFFFVGVYWPLQQSKTRTHFSLTKPDVFNNKKNAFLRRPSFKGGYGEESEHCFGYVVEMERVTFPFSIFLFRSIDITMVEL
jgi:hypothetical protein